MNLNTEEGVSQLIDSISDLIADTGEKPVDEVVQGLKLLLDPLIKTSKTDVLIRHFKTRLILGDITITNDISNYLKSNDVSHLSKLKAYLSKGVHFSQEDDMKKDDIQLEVESPEDPAEEMFSEESEESEEESSEETVDQESTDSEETPAPEEEDEPTEDMAEGVGTDDTPKAEDAPVEEESVESDETTQDSPEEGTPESPAPEEEIVENDTNMSEGDKKNFKVVFIHGLTGNQMTRTVSSTNKEAAKKLITNSPKSATGTVNKVISVEEVSNFSEDSDDDEVSSSLLKSFIEAQNKTNELLTALLEKVSPTSNMSEDPPAVEDCESDGCECGEEGCKSCNPTEEFCGEQTNMSEETPEESNTEDTTEDTPEEEATEEPTEDESEDSEDEEDATEESEEEEPSDEETAEHFSNRSDNSDISRPKDIYGSVMSKAMRW